MTHPAFQWGDAAGTYIRTGDGRVIPADDRNGDYRKLISDNIAITPYQSDPFTDDDYTAAVQTHIDDVAKSRGYTSGDSVASYATSTIVDWSTEARAFVSWRDQAWTFTYEQLSKAAAAKRSLPPPLEFVAEVPAIVW